MTLTKRNKDSWQSGVAKTITFIVTKDCQLACKYCYLVGKNVKERMPWEVAKNFIDYVLDRETDPDFAYESVVWDFIGGEPFLEIELIDKICDYIKTELYRRNHHWFNSYRFSFSSNGINYHEKAVQEFIKKNLDHLSIGITIDGTEKKHDINRVYKITEKGSYKDVVKNIPLWLDQFPSGGTKVTISSADIPYITDSVLHLYSLGIHEVNINVVFEDVWQEGDDLKFEDQLMQLADAIIDNGYYQDYTARSSRNTSASPWTPSATTRTGAALARCLVWMLPAISIHALALRSIRSATRMHGSSGILKTVLTRTNSVPSSLLTARRKAHKSASNARWPAAVHGAKERTMMPHRPTQCSNEPQLFALCTKLVCAPITIIGTSSTANSNSKTCASNTKPTNEK